MPILERTADTYSKEVCQSRLWAADAVRIPPARPEWISNGSEPQTMSSYILVYLLYNCNGVSSVIQDGKLVCGKEGEVRKNSERLQRALTVLTRSTSRVHVNTLPCP